MNQERPLPPGRQCLAILYVHPTIFVQLAISILSAEVVFFFFFLALTMNCVIHTEGCKKLTYSSALQVRG